MDEYKSSINKVAATVLLSELPETMLHDHATDTFQEVNDAVVEVEEISRNLESNCNAAESFEAFLNRYTDTVPNEEWNSSTSRLFQLGVSNIMSIHGVKLDMEKHFPSFENVDVTETPEENRTESVSKARMILNRIIHAVKEGLAKLGDMMMNFINKFRKASTVLKSLSKSLLALVEKTKYTFSLSENIPAGKWARIRAHLGDDITPTKALDFARAEAKTSVTMWQEIYESSINKLVESADSKIDTIVFEKRKVLNNLMLNRNYAGGITLAVEVSSKGSDYVELKSTKIKVDSIDIKVGPTVPVLELHEIKSVATELEKASETILEIADIANKNVSTLKKSASNLDKKIYKDIIVGVGALSAKLPLMEKEVSTILYKIALDAHKYAKASVTQYM